MNDPGTQDLIQTVLAKFVAREIEWCAEMARQWGFKFPREYDVGVTVHFPTRVINGKVPVRVLMRLDQTRTQVVVDMGPLSHDDEEDGWSAQVARQAHTLVHLWLEANGPRHPERSLAVKILEANKDEDALLERVRANVARSKFEARR